MNDRKNYICLFVNHTNKTFCIRNRNLDSFNADFQTNIKIICSEEISIIENVIRINKLYGSDNFQILDIVSAENRYNRDQKQINLMKNFEINQYKNKGYTWDDSLDEFIKPVYNDNEENRKIRNAIINYRNLATLYEEEKEKLNMKLNDAINNFDKMYKEKEAIFNNSINELKNQFRIKKDKLDNEYNSVQIDLSLAKKNLENAQNQYRIYREEYETYKKEIDEINKFIADRTKGKEDLINEYKSIKNDYDKYVANTKNQISELNNKAGLLNDEISHLENRKKVLQEDITKYINKNLSYNVLNEKLDYLIKMIKLNDKYYHGFVPNYEIEYLIKIGLNKEIIIRTLNENGLKIK